ncbi:SurA N-terminal domain-containing protein [Okibacterium endophyticum]
MKKSRLLLSLGLVVSLFGVVACSDSTPDPAETGTGQSTPTPDLEGLPDVVAVVNETEITKEDFAVVYKAQFQTMLEQAQSAGEEPDQAQMKTEALEGMVNTELLVQEADRRGVTVSAEDIDASLEELAVESGMASGAEFLEAVAQQGTTADVVREQLEIQVKLDRMLVAEVGDAAPTEQELRDLYDLIVSQQEQSGGDPAEIPPFEEVQEELIGQAQTEKKSAAAQSMIAELRESADITLKL